MKKQESDYILADIQDVVNLYFSAKKMPDDTMVNKNPNHYIEIILKLFENFGITKSNEP